MHVHASTLPSRRNMHMHAAIVHRKHTNTSAHAHTPHHSKMHTNNLPKKMYELLDSHHELLAKRYII